MAQPRLWTRTFVAGTLLNFLLLLNYYLLMVLMADYAADVCQANASRAGLAASLFVLGALAARFAAPGLMDHLGARDLLLLGAGLEVLASALYFATGRGLAVLFLVRLLHGLSYGLASTAVSTVVTGTVPAARHGEGIGYFMLSVTLGAAIGPYLGMSLLRHGGWPRVFAVCVATAALCLLGALLLRALLRPDARTASGPHRSGLFEPRAVPICAVCAGIYFCYSGIIAFLSPYAASIGLEDSAAIFFLVYSAAILVTRPFTGRLFDRRGARPTMLPAFAAFLVGMLLLGLVQHGAVLLLAAALLGFGIGVIQSCGLAMAVDRAPAERLGHVNATFYSFLDAGTGIGPAVLGGVVPFLGYRGMYLAEAGLVAVFALLFLVLTTPRRR